MTTGLAPVQQLHDSLEPSGPDREAAEAVASALRDAKADNTRRASASAWRQFQTWAEAGGHPALPATPQAVALYLGHLAATGRSLASVQRARSSISHFHAAAGMQKADNPALHPVVAEAVKGWRNRARAPGRPTPSPPMPWLGSANSCVCPGAAAVEEWNPWRPPTGVPPWTWPSSGSCPTAAYAAPRPRPLPGATWSSETTAPAASRSRRARTRPSRRRWRSPRPPPGPWGRSGPLTPTPELQCSV